MLTAATVYEECSYKPKRGRSELILHSPIIFKEMRFNIIITLYIYVSRVVALIQFVRRIAYTATVINM